VRVQIIFPELCFRSILERLRLVTISNREGKRNTTLLKNIDFSSS
jgi:hypothetical protein